jgi:hypothetical protein
MLYKEKHKYKFSKLIEEALELATVVQQQINKPNKDLSRGIESELKDLQKRINAVTKLLN